MIDHCLFTNVYRGKNTFYQFRFVILSQPDLSETCFASPEQSRDMGSFSVPSPSLNLQLEDEVLSGFLTFLHGISSISESGTMKRAESDILTAEFLI